MSRDSENAVMAFKNAWLGAVTSAEELQKMAPAVEALPADTPVTSLDFDGYHRVFGAHANAVMAVRGLLDDLKPKEPSA